MNESRYIMKIALIRRMNELVIELTKKILIPNTFLNNVQSYIVRPISWLYLDKIQ